MATIDFRELVEKSNPTAHRDVLIALDPGETTGYAVMKDLRIIESGQLMTKDLDLGYNEIIRLFCRYSNASSGLPKPDTKAIVEDYRVYSWKTEQHNWAGLHTPKLIGLIHALARIHDIPVDYEMAVEAKGFVTDARLKQWKFWVEGQKHARDAIRHAIFYTLFKTGAKGA